MMTDIEKVLYVHDYLVENTVYKLDSSICYCACGPLAYGYGVCEGYTLAFNLIMTLLGIKTSYIVSTAMNHKWPYVYLDGEWYHIDPTWDDTLSQEQGRVGHHFLLRNDKEFNESPIKKHYSWYNPTKIVSTSQKYSNWFVHDVVGKLYYVNGYWYYHKSDSNSIVRSTIDGSNYKVILDGHNITEAITIVNVTNSQIECIINKQTIKISI